MFLEKFKKMAEKKLTLKQEKFCHAYIETGNASTAYTIAYNATNMSAQTLHNKAYLLMKNERVKELIAELKNKHAKDHAITVHTLLDELEESRKLALSTNQTSAAVSATMGKAKLLGLDKQVLEHTGSIATVDLSNALTSEQVERIALEIVRKQGYEFE